MICPFCKKESKAYSNVFGFHCNESLGPNGEDLFHSFRYHDKDLYDLLVGNETSGYMKVRRYHEAYSIRINNERMKIAAFTYEDSYKVILKYKTLLPFL